MLQLKISYNTTVLIVIGSHNIQGSEGHVCWEQTVWKDPRVESPRR